MAASSSSSGCEFIHEGMVFQILLRLPVSSLLRFKSVCKPWLSLIESPVFISQHTDRSNLEDNQENKLIGFDEVHPFNGHKFISVINLQLSNHVDFNLNTDDMINKETLIASFNGIICLSHHLDYNRRVKEGLVVTDRTIQEDKHFLEVISLWNPATKHVKILPPPPSDIRLITSCDNYLIHYGFGFDNKTKDYRVVRVILDLNEDETLNSQVEVYSLNTDSWRVINAVVPLTISIHSTPKRPFRRNDVFYWLGCEYISKYPVILSFDFSNEVFGTIPMDAVFGTIPMDAVVWNHTQILASLSERLACIHRVPDPSGSNNFHCKIWMLDTCGVNESWTKLYTVILEPQFCPLGFSVNGKMVLQKSEWRSGRLLLFDLARQEFIDTPFRGRFFKVAVYKESLVSVKGANGETYSVNSKWKENSSTWDLRVSQMILASNKKFAEILDHDARALIIFKKPKSEAVPGLPAPTRWSPPLVGTIKLNTDAIWRSSTKLGTFGWVARNAAGIAVRAACSNPVPMLYDITGEAEAIRSALYGARNAGWESIIIESGYKPLVSMITGSLAPDSRVSRIVDDIKDLCTRITSMSFSVLPMVLNTAAYSLAHHGFSRDDPCTWDQDEMPDWLNDIIAKDRERTNSAHRLLSAAQKFRSRFTRSRISF